MIKLENVRKSLSGREILKGVTFEIPKGNTFVIIGRSGTGKSVTIRHVVGLMKPDSGKVFMDGQDISDPETVDLPALRSKIGLLFQEGALLASLTVGENVALPLVENERPSEEEVKERVAEALRRVEMAEDHHKYPSEISGGMKKRVGLARAIIRRPEIMLYDEPTSGLDPVMATTINLLVRKMQKDLGVTSIVVTHDMESAFMVGDQIGMLYQGKIIEVGTPEEIRTSSNPIVRQFIKGDVEGPITTAG
ncbi:MAG: ABC transporter ATP-binding protein [Planctomycetota bacterium]|nr:ABC transporter ATP-binding protein [Planctomycetota bacterium]